MMPPDELEKAIESRRRNARWVTTRPSFLTRARFAWAILFRKPHGHTPFAVWDGACGTKVVGVIVPGPGHFCTVMALTPHEAFDVARHLTPELEERHRRMREARDALCEISYPAARADQLREVADELDCGGGCPHCGDPEKFCSFVAANDLRALAGALDLKAGLEKNPGDGTAPPFLDQTIAP